MPKRTYITKEEKSLPGHKPMKDRLTLLSPPRLGRRVDGRVQFYQCKVLPPNTTPLIQPMDQQVISNFKKFYTKALFQRCLEVTSDTELTLREFWENHFNILYCLHVIDKAWRDVSQNDEVSMEELWPDTVPEHVFDDIEEDAPIVEDILSLGKSMCLEMSSDDVEELVEDHQTELTTEELQNVLTEQQQAQLRNCLLKRREEQVFLLH
ncbi:hypothetical protein mRhiFer1_008367 [Rhinolophus ferrumequinum]|uniref:DDE-1 domain-containing protein n=1 Tax=Rhinolophus ferrumequinum TaxID=59479 RepID=A0A7J7VE37_RHIFE|nr:hypothetical protein mRhiFer1_008367 [Rhinolophus ferrumequinum]